MTGDARLVDGASPAIGCGEALELVDSSVPSGIPPSCARRPRAVAARHEIAIVDLMTKLTTISVTTEQHEQLKAMANAEGIAMWELVDRFLRRERRRRIGQMLIETNANRTGEEQLFEAAVAAAGSRSVRDALR